MFNGYRPLSMNLILMKDQKEWQNATKYGDKNNYSKQHN